MTSRITSVPIDCTDPETLAGFWAAVLGWRVRSTGWQPTPHGFDGAVLTPGEDGLFEIDFRWVPEPKRTKNRIHFDVHATDGDQDAELARLLALGATLVDVDQGDRSWHVLADPEGNEFCLCRSPDQPVR